VLSSDSASNHQSAPLRPLTEIAKWLLSRDFFQPRPAQTLVWKRFGMLCGAGLFVLLLFEPRLFLI
jgi:hypothetical protein